MAILIDTDGRGSDSDGILMDKDGRGSDSDGILMDTDGGAPRSTPAP